MKKRRGRSSIETVSVPSWAISEEKDGPALAAALALADLEGRWIRLDASTQRKLLGFPVFGKRAIYSDGTEIRTMHSAAFGTDANVEIWPWAAITRAARAKKRLWGPL